jgi:hypothetical protein
MKCNLSFSSRSLLFLSFLVGYVFAIASFTASRRMPIEPLNNNPQKFCLWSTGTSFSYSFTCDPRASDEWLFRSGGGLMLGSDPLVEMYQSVLDNPREVPLKIYPVSPMINNPRVDDPLCVQP